MANALIKMCDSVSKHGLVNYEYGVMEDDIIRGTSYASAATAIN